ncbi:carboxypeptidase regulatory-like domain-containing protein [Dyadobacter sp. NIV53]|uniref:TonB-dependent receptor n=1 Tax=Dyadobacter sp. NIV53 TaxID=2861765 RepID=UPI001C882B64|nr:carboxypeptidase regulatory-like domain-containing protein [Dyadobacter sp. NIV53]
MNRKSLLFKAAVFTLLLFSLSFLSGQVNAQVTSSSISGRITDAKGETLPGATIKALHEPTGSVYSTITSESGQYTLPNLRVGGPYKLTITFIGLVTKEISDVTTTLGSPVSINIVLEDASQTLNEVVVTGGKGNVISTSRNGTSTFISPRLMQSVPTINRSVSDFARLTPQANTAGNGVSFGGQNNRYNQFTIDGANATDGFGLGSSGTNGGQAGINPISIETIQEMQIVLSPYDVTQGGFTGGGINAVTKSGANMFHGSAYGQLQNDAFIGKSAGYNDVVTRNKYPEFKNKTFGASLSGPIVKNKLFFFINAERFIKSTPLSFDPTLSGSGSNANVDTLQALRNFIKETYNYDPGNFGAINNENKSTSLFARLDWNINEKNTLTLRHNFVDGSNDIRSRTANSVVFENAGYKFLSKSNSTVLELNSTFSSRASNVLRFTFNTIRDKRNSNFFPSLTINNYDVAKKLTIQYNLGSDNSSQVNGLNQDIFTITDNFTLYKGKHTLTFGTNNEFFNSENLFLQNFYGTYVYGAAGNTNSNNISNFMANKGLTSYAIGYSTSADPTDKAQANLHAAQFSVYGQDVWSMKPNFKLTYGLRIDLPVFFNKPAANAPFEADPTFKSFDVKTQQMPKASPLFSPRVGFNWDVTGDATTQLRGGAGLFTGRVPFVWISNQMSNTGVTNLGRTITAAADLANIPFKFDPADAHAGAYIPTSTTTPATVINVIDKNFKFPQVFRANLALDQKLGVWGLIGSLEGIFTKTVNNANYQNINLSENGEGTVALGSTTRPLWTKRISSNFTDVLLLKNTNKGYSYNFTAQVQKPYSKGWSGFLAYTYGRSTSINDLTSSVAFSNWRGAYTTNGLNHLDVANSNFDLGSRVVGTISKEFKYSKNLATTFTLIYTGQSGQRLSYLYSRTITGDDIAGSASGFGNTLVYLPKTAAEANFVDIRGGATASQQWTDFQKFAAGNKYLADNLGKNTKRNEDRTPFEHHFDLRIAQDFIIGKNKLQVFYDVLNVGNLVNKDWGRSYATSFQSVNLFTVVNSGAQTQDGTAVTPSTKAPAMQFNINNMTDINGTRRPYTVSDFTSRWQSQIGARYSF